MNDRELMLVRNDNIRDHQIGGITDGITSETAEDLGFYPPDRYEDQSVPTDAAPSPRYAGSSDTRVPEARRDYQGNLPIGEEVSAGKAAIDAIKSQREDWRRQGDR